MSKYDEDINENPFFQAQLSHLTSFEEVVVILVPQKSSIPVKFDNEDIKSHIIVDKNEEELQTLTGENVVINAEIVKFGDLEVPILFKETHYGQDWEKVKVLCIKRPLTDNSFEFQDDETGKSK